MKIYVITKGSYSDYHICGVSTEKEKAEEFAKMCSDNFDEAMVEEYETEIIEPFLKDGKLFRVMMRPDETIHVRELNIDSYYINQVNKVENGLVYWVYVIARDKEHAKKIALDKIYQYKYEKENGWVKEEKE